MTAVPLPGPLEEDPTPIVGNLQTARAQLGAALGRITLGDHDRTVERWLTGLDIARIATVASWLRRSYEAGITDGRADRLNEHPVIAALTARVEQLERQARKGST